MGYRIHEFLKTLGFDESHLLLYSSAEECDQLLSKGNENGGTRAAIDEAPYMNIVIAKYCPKCTKVASPYLRKMDITLLSLRLLHQTNK